MDKRIPSMGGDQIQAFLERQAGLCRSSVVEVGSWLGAGTVALARGSKSSGCELHVYDQWEATESEVEKARAFGLELCVGQNLLPLVEDLIRPIKPETKFYRGDLAAARYNGRSIGLYVDDAAKRKHLFDKAMSAFAPHWEDGCVVVLMDFFHFEKAGAQYRYQFEVVERFSRHFERLDLPGSQGTSQAAFRYHRGNGDFVRWANKTGTQKEKPRASSVLKAVSRLLRSPSNRD
jgi:hypothetical protein